MRKLITAVIIGTSSLFLTGCGHTQPQRLPPASHCVDDVQYFRPGPEYKLLNAPDAIQQYRASREALSSDAPPSQP